MSDCTYNWSNMIPLVIIPVAKKAAMKKYPTGAKLKNKTHETAVQRMQCKER